MVLSIQCFKKQTKISKQKQRKGALKERGCFFWVLFYTEVFVDHFDFYDAFAEAFCACFMFSSDLLSIY